MPLQLPIPTDALPCPDPPPCPSCGWNLELNLPDTYLAGDHLAIEIREGWSPSSGERCGSVVGRMARGGEVSEPAVLSMPADCIATPDAPPAVALALGLAVLAGRRRARRPETKRAGLAPT